MPEHSPLTEDRVKVLISEALQGHEDRVMQYLDRRFSELHDTLTSAFPEDDLHAHRLAHEQQIAQATNWSRMKSDIIGKVVTMGLWAAAVFFAVSVWESVKNSIRGGS